MGGPVESGGYRSDESKWPEIQDAMIAAMARLEKALGPHLEKLKMELASQGDRDGSYRVVLPAEWTRPSN
jgi:hypothetical protein